MKKERILAMKKTIGIIFADPMEYAPFEKATEKENCTHELRFSNESFSFLKERNGREIEIIAVKSGAGKSNAASATAFLIGCDKADIIMNAGLSGAVSNCRRGDMIVGEKFVECDFDLTSIGYKPAQKPDGQKYIYSADETLVKLAKMSGISSGNFGSGDLFLTDKEKKDYFKKEFSLTAFDMETGAIAAVCDKCNIPFLSVRKMSDDADDTAYSSYKEMNEAQEECLSDLLLNVIDRVFDEDSLW